MVTYEVHVVNLPEQPAVVIRGHVDHDGIAAFLSEAFGEIMALLQRQHAQITGASFGRCQAAADGGWDIEAGFPVENTLVRLAVRGTKACVAGPAAWLA